MQLAQELEPQLVFGVASRVEDGPAACDPRRERSHCKNQHDQSRLPNGPRRASEDDVDRRFRLPVDAIHRELKRCERERPYNVLGRMTTELPSEGRRIMGIESGFLTQRWFGSPVQIDVS